ncbi:MAG: efflux RND transporter permease subunit [Lachnospiraceae bacterium]|nr:efflux RND transporter permease subunit [Lachnospiraceae bacterium]
MFELTKAVIKRPVTVIVTLVGLVLFSIVSVRSMDMKLMPDINIPMMVVAATYPDASPEEVDKNVIDKIRESCSTIADMKKTITQSYENYGMVLFQFNYGADMDQAREDIRAKLDLVQNDLPDDVKTPTIIEMDFDAMDDMTLSVSSKSEGVDVLKLVQDELDPQLHKAAAMADMTVTGGDESYIAVRIIPEYATQYGVNATTLVTAIKSLNYSMPAGNVSYGDQTLNMETSVEYNTLEKIRQIPITTARGTTIHLQDIANVSYGISEKTELSRYNGYETVSVSLKRKASSTSVTLSHQVKEIVDDFLTEHPDVNIEIIYDAADEIESTLKSVATTLVEGILIAMLVIFIFFGDLKGSLIVGSTMPISLLAALVLMNAAGISLNLVSLNGLVLSIGMITDNAVVVIEMCFKRQEEGMKFKDAALAGTKTVIGSVVGSTITTVVVYLPLVFLAGLSGQLFKQMGLTIVFVLLASLISAVTFVPFFFTIYRPKERLNNPVTKFINWIAGGYAKLLRPLLNFKVLTVVIAAALFGLSIYLASGMPTELLAATDEGVINIDVTFRPNLSLENMDKVVRELEHFVEDSNLSGSMNVTITENTASARVTAYKRKDIDETTAQVVDLWNTQLQNFSDNCEITVSPGSTGMTAAMGSSSSQELDLAADDLPSLRAACRKVKDLLEPVPGVLAVTSTMDDAGAKVLVDVDPEMAAAKGFAAVQVPQMVYANMKGTSAGDVSINNENFEVKVEYPKGYFSTLEDVQSMTFMNPMGQSVPLTEMAQVRMVQGTQTVSRTDGRFSATINVIMTEKEKDAIMEEMQPQLDALDFDDKANFVPSMTDQMMEEEFDAIKGAIIVALYLVFMVMAIQFESAAHSILIMLCIPFAAIGSVFMLLVMGVKISMTALLGVLMLSGIVVNNGIIFIDTANQFREQGEEIKDALVHAGRDRLRPILITTLTTELSMLPVAFKLAKNADTMQAMAVVIVGGLLASTLLTLLLIPTFYLLFEVFRKKKRMEEE